MAAAEAIRVEYEPIEGIFDIEEAIRPDARLIHPEYKSNIVVHYPLTKEMSNRLCRIGSGH